MGLLYPGGPDAAEHVGGSRIGPGRCVVALRPHHGGGSAKGHREAEGVPRGPVRGAEVGLLDPGGPEATEHVCRPDERIIAVRPHHRGVPVYGHRVAEKIEGGPVGAREVGLLGPGGSRPDEHVCGPGLGSGGGGVGRRPHHRGVPAHGHRVAE